MTDDSRVDGMTSRIGDIRNDASWWHGYGRIEGGVTRDGSPDSDERKWAENDDHLKPGISTLPGNWQF